MKKLTIVRADMPACAAPSRCSGPAKPRLVCFWKLDAGHLACSWSARKPK